MSDRYIFRTKLNHDYTVLPNTLIEDTRMSWEARGLLIYLLSRPKDWTVRKTDLERKSEVGGFAVSTILKELEGLRYIYREKYNDSKGQWQWRTWVFDEPIPPTIHQSTADGEPPDIISTEGKQSNTTKGDVLDAILKYSKKGEGVEDYPADVVPLLQAFIKSFGREPVPQEKSGWIAEARKWLGIGIKPSDIKPMYRHCKDNNLAVKSPFSITFAYDELRQGGGYDAVAERAKAEAKRK